jgi:hypothetical protein
MDGTHSLMSKQSGYPGASRDWHLPELPCKATACLWNQREKCTMVSAIVMGPDGRCVTFKKQKENEEIINAEKLRNLGKRLGGSGSTVR